MNADGWIPADYAQHARFVSDLGMEAFLLLAPRRGERILDIGCGDGALTLKIKQAGADVVGIDADEQMVEAARERGIDAWVDDAQKMNFVDSFDAVFSNAALHWMPNDEAVARGVFRALKPGGRFVGEFGAFGNIAAIRTALRAAMSACGYPPLPKEQQYFPKVEEFKRRLQNTGFRVEKIGTIHRPTPLATGMDNWLKTFRGPMLSSLPESLRKQVIGYVLDYLAPVLRDHEGVWYADYVRLRFKAVKSAG